MDEKGGITFFCRKFLVSQFRKHSWTSLRCFRKFGVSKNFMHNRGYHNFPSKLFLSHSAEKLRIGTLWCFTNVGYQKLLGISRKMVLCWHRQVFCRHTNILIKICPQLKTRLLFKSYFTKVVSKHQFHH